MYEWLIVEWGVTAAATVLAVNVGAIIAMALVIGRWLRRKKKP